MMKRSIAARMGALVTAIMLAFFMILPEIVRAGGDGANEPETVIEEEIPVEEPVEIPVEENVEIPEEQTPEEIPVETPAEETPAEETPEAEVPEESPSPDEEVEAEIPVEEVNPDVPVEGEESDSTLEENQTPEEAVSEEPKQEETQNPEVVVPQEEEGDDTPEETASMKPGLKDPEWSLKTTTVTPVGENGEIPVELTVEDSSGEFTIEGDTITKYNGNGGYLVIPEGVKHIADNAFYGNEKITGISLPASVTSIGNSAFNGCNNLESVTIPSSITSIGVSAFANCTALSSVTLNASVQTVSQGQFYNCPSLKEVIIPDGITSIESDAFGKCGNLTRIVLPKSLVSLDLSAFSGDDNLTSIEVTADNKTYSSYDGCVYSKDGKELLLCPQGKTSTKFSENIETIGSGAFNGCNYMTKVTIPDSVTTIAEDAFSGSTIKSLVIPSTVVAIGNQTDWAPDIVYGYADTTAEAWADDNSYIFENLKGEYPSQEPVEPDDPDDPVVPTHKPDDGASKRPGERSSKKPQGTNTTTVSQVQNSSAMVGQGHVKDITPKTGSVFNSMYYLFTALLSVGAGMLVYSIRLRKERDAMMRE